MLCEKCGKNNATTHIRSVVNGVVVEKNLCGYCAAGEGYGSWSDNSLTQMLASMLGDVLSANSPSKLKCSCCGVDFSYVAESGKAGCPECYKTFYNQLLPYLKRVHGSTKHSGKIPNRAPLAVVETQDSVDSLKTKLAQLIAEENFEEAAIVRDKIRDLEASNNELV